MRHLHPKLLLLSLALLLCAVLLLSCSDTASSACENGHTPGEWSILLSPTSKTEGKRQKACTVCGTTLELESIPATGDPDADTLLEYELLPDGSYGVRATSAALNATSLTIPALYEGKSVTRVLAQGFSLSEDGSGALKKLKTVSLPDSITVIGDLAFAGCESLVELTLPQGVLEIGERAFYNCYALERLCVPSSIRHVGSAAFSGCASLQYNTDPYGIVHCLGNAENSYAVVVYVTQGSASECFLPSGCRVICSDAFSNTVLDLVLLPASLCRIDQDAFLRCEIGRFYYMGDAAALSSVSIPLGALDTQSVYLFCDTAPTAPGNYWYFDGQTPTPWPQH